MTPFALSRLPGRRDARHPRVIENLLAIADFYQPEVVEAFIGMLSDLHRHGRGSRYVRKLRGLPPCELKTRARGGAKGGARIYFAFSATGTAILFNAEVEKGSAPSVDVIAEALEMLDAWQEGTDDE